MHPPPAESTNCPRCGFSGPTTSECPQCGIVYAKYRAEDRPGTRSSERGSIKNDPSADPGSVSAPTRFTLLPWLVGLLAVGTVIAGFDAMRQEDPNSGEPQPGPAGPTAVEKVSPPVEPARRDAQAVDPMSVLDAAWAPAEDPAPLPEPAPEPQQTAIPSYSWYEGASGFRNGLEEAQQGGKAMAVYFYTDWCPYCRELESELLTRAKVEDFLKYLVKIRINPENGPRERAIANEYGVRGYPSFFIQPSASSRPRKMRRTTGNRLMTPEQFVVALEKAAR